MSLKKRLLSSSRLSKKLIVAFCDFLSICIATFFALYISDFDFQLLTLEHALRFSFIPFFCLVVFWYSGVYSSVVRYIDFSVIYIISKAILLTSLLIGSSRVVLTYLFFILEINNYNFVVNIEGWIVGFLTFSFLIYASRFLAHYFLSDQRSEKRVAIYGAGSAGIQLASALRVSKEMQPVAFIDRNVSLHGNYIGGIKVLHPKKLEKLVSRNKVDEVLIAMPSAPNSVLRDLLKEIENYSIKVRVLPGLAELAQGKILVSELKEVNIEDLLGRSEVEADQDLLEKDIKDKIVLVTGAGGSIGSEIAKKIARIGPRKLIVLDSNEFALYEIKNELESFSFSNILVSVIANVTNKKRILDICKAFGVDTIYHSAAYKHVPLVEENPFEGVINNIFGTKACVEAAIESNVQTFVLISTDKAVRPANIMGASKRFAELVLQSYSDDKKFSKNTKMTMVRFGNVLGSSGSAIPLFQKQINDGGPVTVTHPEITRYFMSIPEAAELVIQAGAMGVGGDVFVLDMGEAVKIVDLAKRLINLSGLELKDEENPNGDIEIIFTGLRSAEKLYEELLIGENTSKTSHRQILRAEEDFVSKEEIDQHIQGLEDAVLKNDVLALKNIFRKVVQGYQYNQDLVDIVSLQDLENKKA